MKKTDKQTLDMLRNELSKSSENANVPLRLQKESVVTMLKNGEGKEMDFSAETGSKTKTVVALRRITAAAAALIVVVIAALYFNSGGVKVIKTDSFNEAYQRTEPVKKAKSLEDIQQVVQSIFSDDYKEEQSTKKNDESKNPSAVFSTKSNEEGYSEYIAQSKLGAEGDDVVKNPEENQTADGIIRNGDFNADIVKTDGEYLYIVATNVDAETGKTVEQIKIVKAKPAEEMKVAATVILSDGTAASTVDECFDIHLKNNTLIALINRYSYSMNGSYASDSVSTLAVYYDISDPVAPVKIREHIQQGSYVSSALYENSLCLLTEKSISETASVNGANEIIPFFTVNGEKTALGVEDIFIAVNDPEASCLIITVTDIISPESPVGKLAVIGCGKDVYCSAHTLAVARGFVSVEPDIKGDHASLTEFYRFNIDGTKIEFAGSYVAEGTLTGSISVDETEGYLKAVTAQADANNLYILDKNMNFVSGLEGIFKGNRIKSIKYIGSNAYIVADDTNEKTMIIDLSDPASPKTAGDISMQGFSQELYAVSEDSLLGIGSSDNGAIGITLFDISDPSNPQAASVYSLEGDFSLISQSDSRCVMLDSEKKLFGIPIVNKNPQSDTEISAYIVFDVSEGEIVPVGTYNHDTAHTGDAAVRGICIDNTLYTVSGERVVAFSIDESKVISSQIIR